MLDKMLKQGAEAKIYVSFYLNQQCIVKERFPRQYRHPTLDKHLIKERIRAESKGLLKSKQFGVKTPAIYAVDLLKNTIFLEYFPNAITVKEYLMKDIKDTKLEVIKNIGKSVAKLHKNNLIHGDLTTSNILIDIDFELIFIDFGLSRHRSSIEDKAVDLYVLKRALISTQIEATTIFEIILNSYKTEMGSNEVLLKFHEVQSRGRKRTSIG